MSGQLPANRYKQCKTLDRLGRTDEQQAIPQALNRQRRQSYGIIKDGGWKADTARVIEGNAHQAYTPAGQKAQQWQENSGKYRFVQVNDHPLRAERGRQERWRHGINRIGPHHTAPKHVQRHRHHRQQRPKGIEQLAKPDMARTHIGHDTRQIRQKPVSAKAELDPDGMPPSLQRRENV